MEPGEIAALRKLPVDLSGIDLNACLGGDEWLESW